MREACWNHDWSKTAVGAVRDWPDYLRALVGTTLDHPVPQVLTWGRDHIIVAYNDGYLPLLGGKKDVLGRPILDVWYETRDVAGPQLQSALEGRSARYEEAHFVLYRHGSPEEVWFDYTVSPLRAPNGEVVGTVTTAIEITDRVRAQQRDRDAGRRFEVLSQLSPDATLVHADRRLVYANRAALALLGADSADEIVGRSPLQFIPIEHREEVRQRMESVYSGERVSRRRLKWLRLDGEPVDVEVSAGPTIWGGRAAAQVVVRDIAEQLRAEEALRRSDRAKDEFLAVLGHELRNPLAPLRTALDLLERSPDNRELRNRLLPMMDRQLSHLLRLVDDLLDISRVSGGRIELQKDALDLNTPVQAALEQTDALIKSRGHRLQLQLSGEALPVIGDFERLTQVVSNILINAARYTERGGTIVVSTRRRHGEACLSVRDTGIGIAPGDVPRVFELFGQLAEHRHRDGNGGLGIGLALSRQLVEMHGGSIDVSSEGLGQGSDFVVRLPLGEPARRESVTRSAGDSRNEASRRILVVDDNVDAAEALRMLLEHRGHVVETAYDGPAALQKMERLGPEIVLLDLGLPDMDGFEVARRIRAAPEASALRIVAVTGWGQEKDREKTKEAGFDGHLTKPIGTEDLQSVLSATEHR